MNIWFTSDTHWGHANIIKYSKRPFKDVQEMDEMLILNWNSVVPPNGIVRHLGDFCWAKTKEDVDKYANRLNGTIYLTPGNHDNIQLFHNSKIKVCPPLEVVNIEGQKIVLCHYALRTWYKSHRGCYALYGHSHSSLPDDPNSLSFDVGVDCHSYFPISFSQVKAIMSKKTWKPIDHHGV